VSSIGPETWNKPYTPSFPGATGPESTRFSLISTRTGRINPLIRVVFGCLLYNALDQHPLLDMTDLLDTIYHGDCHRMRHFIKNRSTPVPTEAVAPTVSRPVGLSLKKKLAFATLVVVGLPLFLGVGGELALRLYVWARYGVAGKSLGIYQPDAEFGTVYRPNSYTVHNELNNWGFRGSEDVANPKPAGSLRIYCSGNSSTYCPYLKVDQSWPAILQRKLREQSGHERDQVLNAGRPGASVSFEYALAKRVIPRLKPDIVILHTGINEQAAERALVNPHEYDLDLLLSQQRFGVFPRRHLDCFWLRHSMLLKLLSDKSKRLLEPWTTTQFRDPGAPKLSVHPWTFANFDHVLPEYIAYLRSQGCRVIFIRFGDTGVEMPYLEIMRTFRERGVPLARRAGATICDVVPAFERHPHRGALAEPWSGVHVTPEGGVVLADELLKTIVGFR
jgi:GDSL-like Lipase/Acylhydrolase family